MSTMTTAAVRKENKEQILRYIYRERSSYQKKICEELNISRPTAIPILRECEQEGVIYKSGYYDSTGGRKPSALHFYADSRIAIGVELLRDSFRMTALNLYGETLKTESCPVPFAHCGEYYEKVCRAVTDFIAEGGFLPERILGIGIVLQGLISSDGKTVTYGKILGCTGLTVDAFTKYLEYPCKLFHDAEAAAQDELWLDPNLVNGIYMNIREHVSGAVIVNRSFLKGTNLKSGVFEHMSLIPGGRPCYCGHNGCVETYCSTQSFLELAGSLENFFRRLKAEDSACVDCWAEYLDYLASCINNLRMFIDYPVILGGELAPYLEQEDIDRLHRLISEKTAFPLEKKFISVSRGGKHAISRGAALPYIREYLDSVMGDSGV